MNTVKIFGAALIAAGLLALAYGGFSYTKESHTASIGSFELSVSDDESVNVPVWIGVVALVSGGFLLVAPRTG